LPEFPTKGGCSERKSRRNGKTLEMKRQSATKGEKRGPKKSRRDGKLPTPRGGGPKNDQRGG